jgi:hypothetical protein
MTTFWYVYLSRESGVVRPIVTARARITNLTRPARKNENGGIKIRD